MKILDKIKSNKKLEITIYVSLAVIAILIYILASAGSSDSDNSANSPTQSTNSAISVESVEKRLEATLSQIQGAGKVSVMITYDTTSEIVPALSVTEKNSISSSGTESNLGEAPATVQSGSDEMPIVLTEIQPKVRGVIIVAEGACDINVRLNLEYAAKAVLGVDADCIEVFEMGSVNIND